MVTINATTVIRSLWVREWSNGWWAWKYKAKFAPFRAGQWWLSGHRSSRMMIWLCVRMSACCTDCADTKIYTQCRPDYLQMRSGRSDHILMRMCLHLALMCVFPYIGNLSGYRSHFNTRCKWGVSVEELVLILVGNCGQTIPVFATSTFSWCRHLLFLLIVINILYWSSLGNSSSAFNPSCS